MGGPWSSPQGVCILAGEIAMDSGTFRPKSLLHPSLLRSDASLYCDDVDIRFSKTMNSCKVLQIRYASVERLLERLSATSSFPSQLEGKIGLTRSNPRGKLRYPS